MFFIIHIYNIKCTHAMYIYIACEKENEIGLVLLHLCGALQIIYIQHVNDMLQVCCYI